VGGAEESRIGPGAALRAWRWLCGRLSHYGMAPIRDDAGIGHENGSVEAGHGHLKTGLEEGA
jgi:hypothetical protein